MRTRRAQASLLLLTGLAVALTACGGSDSGDDESGGEPTSSASSPAEAGADEEVDACALLTTDQVAEAVGTPVKAGIPSSGPAVTGGSFSSCTWQSDDPESVGNSATVTIYPNAAAADSAREDDSQDIEGIGDKAFSVAVSGVWTYVGERSFLAQWYVFNTFDDEGLEQSKALATAAADALG